MTRSKSSQRWLKQHFNDPYVKRAHQEGMRSRSAYKLLEIQKKYNLIKSGMVVVDLGAAPGGWSQLVATITGKKGHVYAIDILPMNPIPHVEFIQGDFCDETIVQRLISCFHTSFIDLVISDMAPNLSGIRVIDQPRSMHLAELALDFTQRVLKPKGTFIIKTFQGTGFESYLRLLRTLFKKVLICKPAASRGLSTEVYLVAVNYQTKESTSD